MRVFTRVLRGNSNVARVCLFVKVTIHTLPHSKYIRLVSVRSSHLPFKMHEVGFRAFKSRLYRTLKRANRTDFFCG